MKHPKAAPAAKVSAWASAQMARAVQATGYATDPSWADKVIRIERQVRAALGR
jgi:flagellum-specific peptidoglycan hydrolase FlgJ